MANLHDSVVSVQAGSTFSRLWHILAGIYFWEFFATLDYEWRVFRGQLPYRWTIWIYSFARVTCLVAVILSMIGMDGRAAINCQLWTSLVSATFCLSLATSSLLIVLRINAIWNGNKVVMAAAISLWLTGFVLHIVLVGAAWCRSTWDPVRHSCLTVFTKAGKLAFIPTIFVDLVLLVIMLVGLVSLRRSSYGSFGVTLLVLKQGVIWVLLALVSEGPQLVVAVMSSNDQLIEMLLTPGLISMIIASTRMHRFLIDFASGSLDITLDNVRPGSVAFSKSIPTQTASILPNRIEVTVHRAFEQHPTPQKNDHRLCESENGLIHEKSNVWSLGDDVERGV